MAIKVLLNCTKEEANTSISGDISYYKTLMGSSDSASLNYNFIDMRPKLFSHFRKMSSFLVKITDKLPSHKIIVDERSYLRLFSRSRPVMIKRKDDFHIIHSHLSFPFFHPLSQRIPIVWSSQGILPDWIEYKSKQSKYRTLNEIVFMYKYFGRRSDILISWTEIGAKLIVELAGVSPEKVRFIPPFIDLKRLGFLGERNVNKGPSRNLNLIFVGDDAERKGLRQLILAFNELCKIFSNIELHVVGNPSNLFSDLLQSNPKIKYYGQLPNINILELYKKADIFVMPTFAETFGMVFIEAMAHRLPIISSKITPIQEVVEDGKQGILVDPSKIEEIIKALKALIENADLRRALGENALLKVKTHYSSEVVLSELLSAYQDAITKFMGENKS